MVEGPIVSCPSCGAPSAIGNKFCAECGSRLPLSCPSCTSPVQEGQKFCSECGTRLAAVSSAVQEASVVVAPVPASALPVLPEEDSRLDRRIVSVLFCDLVGFTPLSEKLDPEEVREVQDAYFGLMSAEIQRFEGTVEKYAGDAVLAIFGAPIAHEDDAERAVRCAMAMHAALVPLAEETLATRGVQLALRIGVNSGEVVSGLREGGGRVDYAVTGDAVNTASRYQTAAQPGGVMVGEQTMLLARRGIRFGEKQMLTLKGKKEPAPGYPVLGLRERLAERWELTDHSSHLVGRENELNLLLQAWEAAAGGNGRAIEIAAEPGVGKSRLSAELHAQIAARGIMRTIRGRCLSYSVQLSLWLVADLLRDSFGLPEHAPSEEISAQVTEEVRSLLAALSSEQQAIAVDVFGETLGLPPGTSILAGAAAEVRRRGLVQSLQLLLRSLSSRAPILLFLEDLHWVDDASRDVLTEVLNDLPSLSIFVLTTRRPEGAPLLGDATWAAQLALGPLRPDDALILAASVLGGTRLSPALREEVIERSGGNPFFVEELLREVRDSGGLEERDGEIYLLPGTRERLPSTLHELLLARLDRLDRSSRGVAQVASVIGRSFAVRLLAGTMQVEERNLDEPLDVLQRAEVALPTSSAEREYAFKHATFQETAYRTLLKKRRQLLHASVGHSLIDLYPVDEYVDIIAYHFSQTDEHAAAALWLERSADRAVAVFANDAAVDRYREVLRRQRLIGASRVDIARVEEKLGRVLRTIARYDEALAALDDAAAAYRMDDPEGERRVVAEIGRAHRARSNPADGVARIKDILALHSGVAPTSGLAALHVVLARLYFTMGNYEEVANQAHIGAEMASQVGDRRVLAEAEMSRSIALHCLGQTEKALAIMEAAVPVAESVGEFEVLANLLNNIALIYREVGELARSQIFRARSAEVNERRGDMASYALAIASLGELSFVQGDWTEAQKHLERALEIVRPLGASFFSCLPRLILSQVHIARGEFEAASAYLDEVLTMAREGDQYAIIRAAVDRLAELDLLRGEPESAVRRYEGVVDLVTLDEADATLTGTLPILAWAQLESGDTEGAASLSELAMKRAVAEHAIVDLLGAERVFAAAAGYRQLWDQASAHFQQVLALARQVQSPYAEGLILYEWGRMLVSQGKSQRAMGHLVEARDIFRRLGAVPYLQRTEDMLSRSGVPSSLTSAS